jgi:hypothetical protein
MNKGNVLMVRTNLKKAGYKVFAGIDSRLTFQDVLWSFFLEGKETY